MMGLRYHRDNFQLSPQTPRSKPMTSKAFVVDSATTSQPSSLFSHGSNNEGSPTPLPSTKQTMPGIDLMVSDLPMVYSSTVLD